MVDKVSFNGGYSIPKQYNSDIENIAKYTLGTNIVAPQENPFDGMGLMLGITGLMESFKVVKWVKDAKKTEGGVKSAWAEEKGNLTTALKNAKETFSNGGWKKADTYKNIWNNYSANTIKEAMPDAEKMAKLVKLPSKEAQTAVRYYNRTSSVLEYAKLHPEKQEKALKIAEDMLAKANASAHGQIKATGFFGKIGEFFGKITGASKLSGAIKDLATKSPLTEKLLRLGKGNGIFLAITGGIELFTQVIPSFAQLGAGKGLLQLGKSTVKTAANIGGWVAGAAAGAAIGSVIPGAGTLIGGIVGSIIGMVGGTVGSWAATKLAQGIVGKDELEIDKEEKANEIAKQASSDSGKAQELMTAAAQKIQAEGNSSEDSKIAFSSLKRLAEATTQQAPAAPTNYNYNIASTTNPFADPNYRSKDFMAMTAGLA